MSSKSKSRLPHVVAKWKNSGALAGMPIEYPRAYVTQIEGQTVLVDPDGFAVMCAVNKHNCIATLELNKDRVLHFAKRIEELNKSPLEVVIVLINVDDPHGQPITDMLMPNADWQQYRDAGQVPFARGLAMRHGITEYLKTFDKEAALKLQLTLETAIVVINHSVAEIYTMKDVEALENAKDFCNSTSL